MKKLIEIPFNHKLIGKEGIVLKYKNSTKTPEEIILSQVKLRNSSTLPIIVIDNTCEHNFYNLKGKLHFNIECDLDLIMYQEVEVREPRVMYVEIDKKNNWKVYNDKYLELNSITKKGLIKFVEVIEDSSNNHLLDDKNFIVGGL